MSPHFFIDRPIFASVVSIMIMVVGLVAIQTLPVAQFPEITPPMVQIDADYPGASAEAVAESVARPIELQLPGIDNLLYYDSTSTNDGHMTMRLTFEIGTDVDIAQVQTQNRQKLAEPQLPPEVVRQGVSVKKTSPNLLAVIVLDSDNPSHDAFFLSNYAILRVLDNIKRLPGVGDASVYGQQSYSMRIILDPVRMAQLHITPTDIAKVVQEQNRNFPAGTLGREPAPAGTELTIPVITQGRLTEVKDFENLIVRALPDGSIVRLNDVARIELGAQSYNLEGQFNGEPTALLITFLSPGANALDTIGRIRAELESLTQAFPQGMTYDIPYDTTRFIEVSIKEVFHTLLEAMVLVLVVVFVFLQSWRATLIPALAVPVSLIGTFAGMEALGFSINTLTLFGMVLAIGIVVDDAIVVVENVERHMTQGGLSPKAAAKQAMTEVTGPVIAIVLVLSSVFIPVAFLGGITGELYKQFAITIALSVALSGVVALTLSPALCALVLKPQHEAPKGFWRFFNNSFDWVQQRYCAIVAVMLRHTVLSFVMFALLLLSTWGLLKIVPGSFLPEEDQGYFIVAAQLPDGASKQRTDSVLQELAEFFSHEPAVYGTQALSGQNFIFNTRGGNSATMFVPLKPWEERTDPASHAKALIGRAFQKFAEISEGLVLAFNPPSIRGLGSTGGFSLQVQDPSSREFSQFSEAVQTFLARASEDPAIGSATSSFRVTAPRMYARVNRERAKALGIPISEVFDTMQAYFGNLYINDFVKFGRVYRVQTEAEAEYRSNPEDIGKIYVRAQNGNGVSMVPLSTVVTMELASGPDPVTHFNGFNTALVMGSAVISTNTWRVTHWLRPAISTAGVGYGAADSPAQVIFDSARSRAYVSSFNNDSVVVYQANTTTKTVVNTVALAQQHNGVAGGTISTPRMNTPSAMAYDPQTGYAYVLSHLSGNQTTVDPAPAPLEQGNPPLPQAQRIADLSQDPTRSLPDYDLMGIRSGFEQLDTSATRSAIGAVNFNMIYSGYLGKLLVTNLDLRNADFIGETSWPDGKVAINRVTVVDMFGANQHMHIILDNGGLEPIAQPTAMVEDLAHGRVFIAGYGSGRVGILSPSGPGLSYSANFKTAPGPRGLAIDGAGQFLYVYSRVENAVYRYTISTNGFAITPSDNGHNATVPLFDPTYDIVKEGREVFNDAENSGNNSTSCASCHIDGRKDGLGWDLSAVHGTAEELSLGAVLDDFSVDSSANYTLENSSGAGGSFTYSPPMESVFVQTGGASNTVSLMRDDGTSFLEVGEQWGVEAEHSWAGGGTEAVVISTVAGQPVAGPGGSVGIRFIRSAPVWSAELIGPSGVQTILSTQAIGSGPGYMWVHRVTEERFVFSFKSESSSTGDVIMTVDSPDLAGHPSLFFGVQLISGAAVYEFDNFVERDGIFWKDRKGIMVTQDLRSIEEVAPYHWRGERRDLIDFNGAFEDLLHGAPLGTDVSVGTSLL